MEWVRGEVIGHGSFGTVNLAVPRRQSPPFPALMVVKSCGASKSSLLMKEKSILEELSDCPQIIRCFGGDFSFENGEKLYNVLLEYAFGGALSDKVRNSRERLTELDIRRYTESILKGLRYIHGNGYVHCDLKLQNVLLCSCDDGRYDVAKVADFGLAKKAGWKGENLGVELRGTPLYMSPETVTAGDQEAPADVWALGCLVAEMVTGKPAWNFSPEADVCGLLMRIGVGDGVPEIPGKLSTEGKDFLGKCFVKDPRKRWTAEMLLNHPFIADHNDDHRTVPLKDKLEASRSTSPTGPFDFPDCESVQSSGRITYLPSSERTYSQFDVCDRQSSIPPADRLRELVTDRVPNWSDSDSWVRVR